MPEAVATSGSRSTVEPDRVTATSLRVALGMLAASGAVVGCWAAFAPRSFFDDFPGPGATWVATDGPYNEHLVRDVGGLQLALVVVAVVAASTLARGAVLAAGLGTLAFAVPHLVYHVRHRDVLDGADLPASLASLTLQLGLGVAVVALGWRSARAPAR